MKAYQEEIKQLQQANKLIESFARRLEKTEISAFDLYRACGVQMRENAKRIDRLHSEANNIAEDEAQFQQFMDTVR